jgi:hypothetical protein
VSLRAKRYAWISEYTDLALGVMKRSNGHATFMSNILGEPKTEVKNKSIVELVESTATPPLEGLEDEVGRIDPSGRVKYSRSRLRSYSAPVPILARSIA